MPTLIIVLIVALAAYISIGVLITKTLVDASEHEIDEYPIEQLLMMVISWPVSVRIGIETEIDDNEDYRRYTIAGFLLDLVGLILLVISVVLALFAQFTSSSILLMVALLFCVLADINDDKARKIKDSIK